MNNEEHKNQAALFEWAELQKIQIRELDMLYAIPNGGHRHIGTAMKLKKEGVKAGVLDINLDVPAHGFHGLRIELKTAKGRITKQQAKWMKNYSYYGYMAVACKGWEAARDTILDYLGVRDVK